MAGYISSSPRMAVRLMRAFQRFNRSMYIDISIELTGGERGFEERFEEGGYAGGVHGEQLPVVSDQSLAILAERLLKCSWAGRRGSVRKMRSLSG